jgi:hypothetical protein
MISRMLGVTLDGHASDGVYAVIRLIRRIESPLPRGIEDTMPRENHSGDAQATRHVRPSPK